MKRFMDLFILIFMGLLLIVAIGLNDEQQGSDSDAGSGSDSDSGENNEDSKNVYWGVDSAGYAEKELLQCVKDNFGEPAIWGRYLGDRADVSQGLDTDEVNALHDDDIHILLIYNHFSEASGYDNGVQEAEKAIAFAKDLDVPDGVAIFGDIEPNYPVDSAFLEGWYETLTASDYEAAFYGVFNKDSKLVEAYNAAKKEVRENTVLWTAYPQESVTTKAKAPSYNAQGPSDALLYGWQYGIDSEKCTIDTNLFQKEILDYLWKNG